MGIQLTCDGCGTRYSVKEELAGKRVKCASCGATLTIPAPGTAAPNASAPAAPVPKAPATSPAAAAMPTATVPAAPAAPAKKPSPASAVTRTAASVDEYDIDVEEAAAAARSATPILSGHRVQPKIDAADEDFELEPPVQVTVTPEYFVDDDGESASKPSASSRPATPAEPVAGRRKQAGQAVTAESIKAAEGLTIDETRNRKEPEPLIPCPSCNAQIKKSSVLCVNCGLNLKTGQKIEAPTKKGGLGKFFGRQK